MAFRADIVKMIEDIVTKIEEHHFKINYSMKQDFVTFINSFSKFHLDRTDINFTLNLNMLYAETDGVKIIIATDSTMTFAVPGCTIPMRNEIEAFIVVDEVVAYDSYKMRRFRKAIQDSSVSVQNAAPAPAQIAATPAAPHNMFTPPAPAPSIFNTPAASAPTTSSTPAPPPFNDSAPSKPPTSTLSFPTTSTPAPTTSSFNFSTPTTTSAFHLSTLPTAKTFGSPTNLFSSR